MEQKDVPPPYSPEPAPGAAPLGFETQYSPAPAPVQIPSAQTVYTQPAGSVQVVTTQPAAAAPVIIVAGTACPTCRAGIIQREFTCCGICLGICFFPLGLLCCFLMQERRCSNCRQSFGSG